MAVSFIDLKRRLRALWLRRNELRAAFRRSASVSMDGVKQRLRASWLRRDELRTVWASPSGSPIPARGLAFNTTRIAVFGIATVIGAAVLALVIGIPVPFLAKAIAKNLKRKPATGC